MALPRSTLVPFFLLSLALHFSFLFFAWPSVSENERTVERIPVSILSQPEEKNSEPSNPANEPRRQPSKRLVQTAKRAAPPSVEIARRPAEQLPVKEEKKEPPDQPDREKYTIIQRPLPTLKELLPPVIRLPSGERAGDNDEAVHLDTKEPKYVSYFTSIKRAIELVWEYPEPALRQGLQGRLILQFTILGNGQLEGARLIRSSGFSVLDQEAVRAVQAASPFHPIPPWIGKNRLDVIASFEYHDNRLKYGSVP